VSPATITAALAQRGAAVGAIVRHGGEVHFTAPGADETEVVAALSATGARVAVEDDLGAVSVIGPGIGRRPEVTARALLALEHHGIDPHLVTTTPGQVSFHVAAPVVGVAVRLLHELFALHGGAPVAVDLAAAAQPA
jgi:aspartate kinase